MSDNNDRIGVGAKDNNGIINGFKDRILVTDLESYQQQCNPLGLPEQTFRVQFKSGYTPQQSYYYITTTLVDATNNIWDIHFDREDDHRSADCIFYNEKNLLKVLGANTTNVTNMHYLFADCDNLTEVALFDTSSVTNMYGMFSDCPKLIDKLPLFDTHNVTDMQYMFYSCHLLRKIPHFNTSSVTTFYKFCIYCFDLFEVPNFDFSSAIDVSFMFYQCTSLITVPAFNFPICETFNDMFHLCDEFTYIPLFTMPKAINVAAMFTNNRNVKSGALALYQRLSTQEQPPPIHSSIFYCGQDTPTCQAERAQIPQSWGGTMPD